MPAAWRLPLLPFLVVWERMRRTRFGRWCAMAFLRWARTTRWLLEFEPTWFSEFGLAVSAVGWGLGAWITDDLVIEGAAYILPTVAICGGCLRALALLRLWYFARVLLASASFLLWGWLYIGAFARFGVIPLPQLLVGAMVMDLLTAAKFTIPCARDLWPHWSIWTEA